MRCSYLHTNHLSLTIELPIKYLVFYFAMAWVSSQPQLISFWWLTA